MPPAPVGFSLDESARRIGGFRWLEARCFEILGAWVPAAPEPDIKLMLARHSAHHGWHAELLADVLPATKDHDPEAVTGAPSAAIAEFLDTVAAATGTAERLVAVYEVLLPEMVGAFDRFADAANPVSDGASRRAVRVVLADDADHLSEGLAAIEALYTSGGASPDAAAMTRDRLAALLAAAGGVAVEGDGSIRAGTAPRVG